MPEGMSEIRICENFGWLREKPWILQYAYCWCRGHTPVNTTADPEVLLGVLISAGSIRCDLIDPAGQVVGREYVRCTAKTVERIIMKAREAD